jgi:hypothetical protein
LLTVNAEGRRRGHAFERLSPEGFRPGEVLILHPLDVVAERGGGFESQFLFAAESIVEAEDIFQDQEDRPAVEQHVMMTPQKLMRVVRRAEQREPHERDVGEFEPAGAVLLQVRLESPLLFFRRQTAPVEFFERQGDVFGDHLKRLVGMFPSEGGA